MCVGCGLSPVASCLSRCAFCAGKRLFWLLLFPLLAVVFVCRLIGSPSDHGGHYRESKRVALRIFLCLLRSPMSSITYALCKYHLLIVLGVSFGLARSFPGETISATAASAFAVGFLLVLLKGSFELVSALDSNFHTLLSSWNAESLQRVLPPAEFLEPLWGSWFQERFRLLRSDPAVCHSVTLSCIRAVSELPWSLHTSSDCEIIAARSADSSALGVVRLLLGRFSPSRLPGSHPQWSIILLCCGSLRWTQLTALPRRTPLPTPCLTT